MCFGGSDDSASREMIQMQKDEAKRVAAKEAEREARIKGGLASIKNMFEGAPVMADVANRFAVSGPSAGTASGAAVSGLPAGYTYVKIPGSPGTPASVPLSAAGSGSGSPGGGGGEAPGATSKSPYYNNNRQGPQGFRNPAGTGQGGGGGQGAQNDWGSSGSRITYHTPEAAAAGKAMQQAAAAGTAGTPDSWAIRGPDGRVYKVGENIDWTSQRDTGKRAGTWQDNFLNEFKQNMLDYYTPQVAEQFGEAKDETTYRHARAGTLKSSGAIGNAADLAKQKGIREGEVRSKADTAAAELKNRIQKERQAAEAQLYATENPEVAANQAVASIRNIAAEEPDLSPLGEIFNIATIGGANLLKGASNAARLGGGYGSGGALGRNQKILGS